VIRIDDEVWAQLQQRAQPLEDTPNSVLRRVFGLAEQGAEAEGADSRVTGLMELVQGLVGETPRTDAVRRGYSLFSRTGEGLAYIRPQRERLRIEASKERAAGAGANDWDRERPNGWADTGGPSVRWYVQDGDDAAYQRAAAVLAKLWQAGD
jgi:hypothetical protein